MKTSNIAFNDIDRAATYEGYLWLSDQQTPYIFFDQKIDENFFGLINPFIIEGLLYDSQNNISYSIRYTDGQTIVTRYELEGKDFLADKKEYLPNHMEGIASLNFLNLWVAKPDPLCCDMEVLQTDALVFVGFNKK